MATEPSAGLAERSVGLRGDWIASITNVAPTAATTLTMAALIGAAGLASPLSLLIAGAAMLCCAVAYHRLNSWQASADAPVHWVARGLSPVIGYAVGILILMTALTSNIGNITLIGSTVLSLIAPSQTTDKPLTWVVATNTAPQSGCCQQLDRRNLELMLCETRLANGGSQVPGSVA